jgi:hypothetical protein
MWNTPSWRWDSSLQTMLRDSWSGFQLRWDRSDFLHLSLQTDFVAHLSSYPLLPRLLDQGIKWRGVKFSHLQVPKVRKPVPPPPFPHKPWRFSALRYTVWSYSCSQAPHRGMEKPRHYAQCTMSPALTGHLHCELPMGYRNILINDHVNIQLLPSCFSSPTNYTGLQRGQTIWIWV